MTLIEKAICECYTGIVFCVGDERDQIYKYLSDKEKRHIYTHEILDVVANHQDEIKKDFLDVLKGKYAGTKW